MQHLAPHLFPIKTRTGAWHQQHSLAETLQASVAMVGTGGDFAVLTARESEIYWGRFSPTACAHLRTAQTFRAGIACACIPLLTFATCPAPPRVPASACAKHAIACAKHDIACVVPSTATSSTGKFCLGGKGLSQSPCIPHQHLPSCLRVRVQTRQWSRCCVFPG